MPILRFRTRLLGHLLFIALISGLGVLLITLTAYRRQQRDTREGAELLYLQRYTARNTLATRSFLLHDAQRVDYYRTGGSPNLLVEGSTRGLVDSLQALVRARWAYLDPADTIALGRFALLHDQHARLLGQLVVTLRERGMEDHGVEGLMRAVAHALEADPAMEVEALLQLRRAEKDYIIRREQRYVDRFELLAKELAMTAEAAPSARTSILLAEYREAFAHWVRLDQRIGVRDNAGLYSKLAEVEEERAAMVETLLQGHQARSLEAAEQRWWLYLLAVGLLLVLAIGFAFSISGRITRPIRALADAVRKNVDSGFRTVVNIRTVHAKDREVHELAGDFALLQQEVKRHVHHLNELVDTRTKELQRERDRVDTRNKEIKESLRYARRLQESILSHPRDLERIMPESFVLNMPKDIVTGDFMWVRELEVQGRKRILFAVADCTGHGVPASLLTVMCHNALNEALQQLEEPLPCLLLDRVNEAFQEMVLTGTGSDLSDGMAISLCSYDPAERRLVFAGSCQPMFVVGAEGLQRIDGDHAFIGLVNDRRRRFSDHYIHLPEDAMVYLISDGFQDQFGGDAGKKFMRSRLAELLEQINACPVEEQRERLKASFEQWKGSYEQVDDVLVFGLRVGAAVNGKARLPAALHLGLRMRADHG